MKLYTKPVQAALLLTGAVFIGGQYAQAVDVEVGGQIRPRVEIANDALNSPGPNVDSDPATGHTATFTTMRTRLHAKANISADVSAFVQIQNVTTWGGEIPTGAPPSITQTGTSTIGNVDVHQAYISLKNVLDTGLDLKIGRQEMVFDEARLIGNIDWIQQGQSFDAARADYTSGDISLTAFFAQTVEKDTHPTLALTVAGFPYESNFSGLRASYSLGDNGDRVTPYFYYADNPQNVAVGELFDNLGIVGLYAVKHIEGFRVRFDGAYEFGDVSPTVDKGAFMLTAAVGYDLDVADGANVTLWYDYLSGNDGTDPLSADNFVTPYATNHAYYGHMDNYLQIPSQGLHDIALKGWVKVLGGDLKLSAAAHWFMSAETLAGVGVGSDDDLGQEIDLAASYPLADHTGLAIGYSHYFGGDALAQGSGKNRLDGNWAFAMLNTTF